MDQGGGAGWQDDDLNIGQLKLLGVAIVYQQENLAGEVLVCQVPLHLRDETIVEPFHKDCSCYPCLSVGPPKYGQSLFVLSTPANSPQTHLLQIPCFPS